MRPSAPTPLPFTLPKQDSDSDLLRRLAPDVAQEVNDLLTVINGYSEMLAEMLSANDSAVEMLQQIHTAGERAAVLNRQLLLLGRSRNVSADSSMIQLAARPEEPDSQVHLNTIFDQGDSPTETPQAGLQGRLYDPDCDDSLLVRVLEVNQHAVHLHIGVPVEVGKCVSLSIRGGAQPAFTRQVRIVTALEQENGTYVMGATFAQPLGPDEFQ
ncbi:MAG: histidine kinase dimerization/phospho-acceptor domain-containing protein, partial [Gemmataceae bacterium]